MNRCVGLDTYSMNTIDVDCYSSVQELAFVLKRSASRLMKRARPARCNDRFEFPLSLFSSQTTSKADESSSEQTSPWMYVVDNDADKE